jgi:signal transduction histidine kinase
MERCLQVQETGDGKLTLHNEHLDIAVLLEALVLQFRGRADLKLEISGPSDLHADLKLLKVLLSNLIDNAVKYGSPKQPIVIHVARVGETFLVEVSNAPGLVGMPDPGRVFEKYYRAQNAHAIIGSGLGLYLMKNIARLMGGDLRYEPADGCVRFVLSIPA